MCTTSASARRQPHCGHHTLLPDLWHRYWRKYKLLVSECIEYTRVTHTCTSCNQLSHTVLRRRPSRSFVDARSVVSHHTPTKTSTQSVKPPAQATWNAMYLRVSPLAMGGTVLECSSARTRPALPIDAAWWSDVGTSRSAFLPETLPLPRLHFVCSFLELDRSACWRSVTLYP